MKRANVTYFLDGAHNIDSMEVQGWDWVGWGGAGVRQGGVGRGGAGRGR